MEEPVKGTLAALRTEGIIVSAHFFSHTPVGKFCNKTKISQWSNITGVGEGGAWALSYADLLDKKAKY